MCKEQFVRSQGKTTSLLRSSRIFGNIVRNMYFDSKRYEAFRIFTPLGNNRGFFFIYFTQMRVCVQYSIDISHSFIVGTFFFLRQSDSSICLTDILCQQKHSISNTEKKFITFSKKFNQTPFDMTA